MSSFTAKLHLLAAYLRYCSAKRLANIGLLYLGYIVSLILRRPVFLGFPSSISVEPANYCNLSCPECPVGSGLLTRAKEKLDTEAFRKFAAPFAGRIVHATVYFQGEPFICSQATELISWLDKQRVVTSTSTNGHFIDKGMAEQIVLSGLKKIVVSLDGHDQESYQMYRIGGRHSAALSCITHLAKAKQLFNSRYPIIEAQVLVLSSTENHLLQIKEQALKFGADSAVFKTAQFYQLDTGNKLAPETGKSRYRNIGGKMELNLPMRARCWRAWANPVVCSSGDIAPCCYDKNADYKIGHISQGYEIMSRGSAKHNFMASIFNGKKGIDICKNCPEGRGRFF
jgi:radical SAM protein with 4Fe4S-binding SPASM domain